MYEFCDRNYSKVLEVVDDLHPLLKRAKSMETDTLGKLFNNMEEQIKSIKNLITDEDERDQYDPDDQFIDSMETFHNKISKGMRKFKMTVGNVEARSKRLMKQFAWGDNDSHMSVESLFVVLYDFLSALDESKNKLVKLEQERQKKRR